MSKPLQKTISMPKKSFNKWIKHLTSGKLKQGHGSLCRTDGSMCCLGVLEYALEGKVEPRDLPSFEFLDRNKIVFLDNFGMKENVPYLTGGTASLLNDHKGLTFKQIAQRLKSRVQFTPFEKK